MAQEKKRREVAQEGKERSKVVGSRRERVRVKVVLMHKVRKKRMAQ